MPLTTRHEARVVSIKIALASLLQRRQRPCVKNILAVQEQSGAVRPLFSPFGLGRRCAAKGRVCRALPLPICLMAYLGRSLNLSSDAYLLSSDAYLLD